MDILFSLFYPFRLYFMNRILFSLVCLFTTTVLNAQLVSFESLPLTNVSYWRGDSGTSATTLFSDQGAIFRNRHDTSSFGDYWSGWAYSKLKDTNSLSYATNDCASIANGGFNGSDQYGVAYYSFQPELNSIKIDDSSGSFLLVNMRLTNSTIAYRSMQNGDGFAKKFGGISGNDPDYFRINFSFWADTMLVDTKTFYLADFRDTNNANDYIVKEWTGFNIGLIADSISYTLESSDTNSFGMKTPAYFCMDDLIHSTESVSQNELPLDLEVYPNPVMDYMQLNNRSEKNYSLDVISMNGAILGHTNMAAHTSTHMNFSQLAPGIYSLQLRDGYHTWTYKITKQ